MSDLKVALLGATGLVGQNIIELLKDHKYLKIKGIFGRPEKEGQIYYDLVDWSCESKLPEDVASLKMISLNNWDAYKDFDLILSALPSDTALDLEGELRSRGHIVVSNAGAYRMKNDVPLMVPEVNPMSLELIEEQRKKYNGGFIVTNPNCCCIGIALALAPIEKSFGLKNIRIVTMQARSGAGLPGLNSSEITANIIPNIDGEENKIKEELIKLFSKDDINIKVRVNRVPVVDGHSFVIWFSTTRDSSLEGILSAIKNFKPECGKLPSLSSAESIYKIYDSGEYRPQPRLDSRFLNGMGTVIGRLEDTGEGEYCMNVVSNNVVRGAAGGTLVISELLRTKGVI